MYISSVIVFAPLILAFGLKANIEYCKYEKEIGNDFAEAFSALTTTSSHH
jgi:hypothetical protein